MRATAFDELAAAMHEFGYWGQLEAIEVALDKDDDDVPDELLLRELGVLPLLRIPNPNQAPTCLFQGRGVLRFLGFTVAQIRDAFSEKGVQSPTGKARMRPHHRDTLYHAPKYVKMESPERFREAHQRALVEQGLVQGGTFAMAPLLSYEAQTTEQICHKTVSEFHNASISGCLGLRVLRDRYSMTHCDLPLASQGTNSTIRLAIAGLTRSKEPPSRMSVCAFTAPVS